MKKSLKNLDAKIITNSKSIKGGNFAPPLSIAPVVGGDNMAAPGHIMA